MEAAFDGVEPEQGARGRKRGDLFQPGVIGDADLQGAGAQLIQILQGVAGAKQGSAAPQQAPAALALRHGGLGAGRMADARHGTGFALVASQRAPVGTAIGRADVGMSMVASLRGAQAAEPVGAWKKYARSAAGRRL